MHVELVDAQPLGARHVLRVVERDEEVSDPKDDPYLPPQSLMVVGTARGVNKVIGLDLPGEHQLPNIVAVVVPLREAWVEARGNGLSGRIVAIGEKLAEVGFLAEELFLGSVERTVSAPSSPTLVFFIFCVALTFKYSVKEGISQGGRQAGRQAAAAAAAAGSSRQQQQQPQQHLHARPKSV